MNSQKQNSGRKKSTSYLIVVESGTLETSPEKPWCQSLHKSNGFIKLYLHLIMCREKQCGNFLSVWIFQLINLFLIPLDLNRHLKSPLRKTIQRSPSTLIKSASASVTTSKRHRDCNCCLLSKNANFSSYRKTERKGADLSAESEPKLNVKLLQICSIL